MVPDLAQLLSLPVKMCDQENGSELSKILKAEDVDDLSASDESEPEEQHRGAPFDPELDDDDDSDGEEVGGVALASGQKAQSAFSLKGGSSGFSSRSNSIFDCLDSVAKLASSALGQDNVIDGVFARPLPPAPGRKTSQPPPSSPVPAKKRGGVPDYVAHPDRWTHYSLEDVPETSERGNSTAAQQFLASLQRQKEEAGPGGGESACNTQQKIIFSRPSRLAKEPAEPSAVRSQDKGMRLSHLEEEEDEQEQKKAVGVEKAEETGEDEVKHSGADASQPEGKEQKERGADEEEEVEEKKGQGNPSFASFRKTNQKKYRKSSQQED